MTFKLNSEVGQKRVNTGLRLLSLERPACKWLLDGVWELDWHTGPYTHGKLSLNDKDSSLCLNDLSNVVYAEHLPLLLGALTLGTS